MADGPDGQRRSDAGPAHPLPPRTRGHGALRESGYAAIAETLYRLLDNRLRDRAWLAGGDYSIADMATQPWAHYLERHGFDASAHPALVEWRERIASRPAVQRALARADEAFTQAAAQTRRAATDENLDRFFNRTATVPVADYSIVRSL